MSFLTKTEQQLAQTPGALDGRTYQIAARATHDATERLRALSGAKVRAAVFGCIHDGMAPPRASKALSEALGEADAHGTPIWFEAGHWPNLPRELPAQFAAALEAFAQSGSVPEDLQLRSQTRAMSMTTRSAVARAASPRRWAKRWTRAPSSDAPWRVRAVCSRHAVPVKATCRRVLRVSGGEGGRDGRAAGSSAGFSGSSGWHDWGPKGRGQLRWYARAGAPMGMRRLGHRVYMPCAGQLWMRGLRVGAARDRERTLRPCVCTVSRRPRDVTRACECEQRAYQCARVHL